MRRSTYQELEDWYDELDPDDENDAELRDEIAAELDRRCDK